MLIVIFLGFFEIGMAFLTMIRIYLENDGERRKECEEVPFQVMPEFVQAGSLSNSRGKASVKDAFSDLWMEILKGA